MAKRITINELDKSALSSSTFEDGKLLTTDTIKGNISSNFKDSSTEKIASTKLTNELDNRVDTVESLLDNSNEYLFVKNGVDTDYDESENEIIEVDGIARVTINNSFTLPNYTFNFPLNLLSSDATKITISKEGSELYSFNFTGQVKRIIDTDGRVKFTYADDSEIDSTLSQQLFNVILSGGETITAEDGSVTVAYPVNQFTAELICVLNRAHLSTT